MYKLVVFPYKMGSQSARDLARAIGTYRVYPDRNYTPKRNHLIINWGNSHNPRWVGNVLNKPSQVGGAANKYFTFRCLKHYNVNIPEFTTVISEAKEWARDKLVVCRKTLTGQCGSGIVLASSPDEVVQAPLYTKHLRHKHEYRVHVVRGEVIDFAQKKKRAGAESTGLIRNIGNNWIFAREGVVLPEDAKTQAIAAVEALGLDFGPVDIAYRERENKA